MLQLGWFYAGIFILYLVIIETRLMKFHCPNCFYYGKVCAFGKGFISQFLFKRGKPERFSCKPVDFKHFIPDLLVFLIPAVSGIVLLILNFNWLILILLLALIFLNFTGNAFIRGQLACKSCKQAELGCPAIEFFNPKKN
jgi:hypothetical protein